MAKASCIIAAFNEEKRVGKIIDTVRRHPLIGEVIVVDDGSTDGTAAALSKFSDIKKISLPENRGKSFAIEAGLKEAREEVIILIDADLIGLTKDDVSALIRPVMDGQADIAMSLRKNSPLIWRWIGLDHISGERVFHRSLLHGHSADIKTLPGFGLETFMNRLIIKNRCRIKVVSWPNVTSPAKTKKHGMRAGLRGEMRMLADILKTSSLFEIMGLIRKMLDLRIKNT